MAASRICSVAGCFNTHHARGYCKVHWKRWRRNGDMTIRQTARDTARNYFETVVLSYTGDDCLVWPYERGTDGRPRLQESGKSAWACRLACARTYGPPPSPLHQAAHSCGKGHTGCINPRHLRWATPQENSDDKYLHGTVALRHPRARLSVDDVQAIRSLRGTVTSSEIAKRFDISKSHASRILAGTRWPR